MTELKYLTIDHLTTEDIARIFTNIIVDNVSGCWNWTKEPKRKYGRVKFNGREESTHRVLYAWLVESIPRGLGKTIPQLDHIVCDNTRCVNPAHLKLVSAKDNTLRTNNCTAINARKTQCKNGHQLPETRNRWDRSGRECSICKKASHQSDSFVKWNKAFGKAYHHARRYGPDRAAFLAHQRTVLEAWKARNPEKVMEYTRKARANRDAIRHAKSQSGTTQAQDLGLSLTSPDVTSLDPSKNQG